MGGLRDGRAGSFDEPPPGFGEPMDQDLVQRRCAPREGGYDELSLEDGLKKLEGGLAMACNDGAADLVRRARDELSRLQAMEIAEKIATDLREKKMLRNVLLDAAAEIRLLRAKIEYAVAALAAGDEDDAREVLSAALAAGQQRA